MSSLPVTAALLNCRFQRWLGQLAQIVCGLAVGFLPAFLYAEPPVESLPSLSAFTEGEELLNGDLFASNGMNPGVDLCDVSDSGQPNTFRPFVNLLYWKLTEGSAENWAQEITPQGLGTLAGTANLVDAPFEWSSGLRAGFDSVRGDDQVSVSLYYTHFDSNATNEAAGEVYSAFLGNFFAGNPDGSGFGPHYEYATVNWGVQFHTIDLELGREFEVSRALTLRPFVGLKSGVIRQRINSTWFDPIDTSSQDYQFNSATEDLKQNFWGIGPSIGVTALVPLSVTPQHSLRIYFTPSGALMYGNWTFSDLFRTDGPTSTTIPTPSNIAINSNSIYGAATMLRMALGLEWEQAGARVTTRFRLGYEAQVWLNQMQFYSYNMGRLNNLMSLQGGNVEVGFSF